MLKRPDDINRDLPGVLRRPGGGQLLGRQRTPLLVGFWTVDATRSKLRNPVFRVRQTYSNFCMAPYKIKEHSIGCPLVVLKIASVTSARKLPPLLNQNSRLRSQTCGRLCANTPCTSRTKQ